MLPGTFILTKVPILLETDILSGLNAAQREAVTTTEGPVLVMAGPGSGKTRVLTHRVAYLVKERGCDPAAIMAVTFTNKASREMKARTERLLGDALAGLTIGTFHSICVRLLRREAKHADIPNDFVIYNQDDQTSLVRQILKPMNLDEKVYQPRSILSSISRAKSELVLPDEFDTDTYWKEVVRRVYVQYQSMLEANHALDFDDLLMRAVLLLRNNRQVRQRYQQRYAYLLVDEFQDTNTMQYELVKHLAGERRNLFVVGDEDQSIYRWRGADYRNLIRFRSDFPEHKVILLEENYRSTQTILDTANAVIAPNRRRTPKRLHTEKGSGTRATIIEAYNEQEEASSIVNTIAQLTLENDARPGGCAIMYRTNAQSRVIEEAFLSRGLPYKLVGATRFYDRREIRDALAYLRLIYNPNDGISLNRIINVPPRAIGAKTLTTFDAWRIENGWTPWDALQYLSDPESAAPFASRARLALMEFASLLQGWTRLREEMSVRSLLGQVLQASGYAKWIQDGTEEGAERWGNVEELLNVAGEYEGLPVETGLTTFLEEVALVSDVDDLAENADAPTLLTLHMAKGLEFPVVFITGLEENILPHSRSMDDPEEMAEERRLFYVGITRAEERLYLLHTFRRTHWGSSEVSEASRFLDDIPPHLIEGTQQGWRERAVQRETRWESSDNGDDGQAEISDYDFQAGDKVEHPKFGQGTIIMAAPSGDDLEVQVAFQDLGIKKFLASFANLEKVG